MPKIYISDKYKFMKRIKALSFFTGAMGLDIALKKSGIDVILACESEKFIRETIKLNNPKLKVLEDINLYLLYILLLFY